MKIKIKPYIKYLIKENLIYLGFAVILLCLSFFVLNYLFAQYTNNQQKISTLQNDIAALTKKRDLISNLNQTSSENLDNDAKLLTLLIPSAEDYFSIISSLDTLSQKTGFKITSYTIDLKNSTSSKLVLSVTGAGDQQSFFNFLKNYKVGGGRLITSDKIAYTPDINGSTTLTLNFYTDKISLSGTNQSSPNTDFAIFEQQLQTLRSKVDLSLLQTSSLANITEQEYLKKNSPF